MKPRVKLLAIDIDGTLLDSRWQLSSANRDAVAAAAQRGVEIVLVTGRRFTFARPIAEQLPVEWTLVASNGAVVKSKQGKTLARRLLPRGTARAVLEAAGEHRRTALLIFDREGKGEIVAETTDPAHAPVEGYFERNRAYLLQVPRLEDTLAADDPIQLLFAGPVAEAREVAQWLERCSCRPEFHLARTEYPERDFTLLDVLRSDCNKGTALAEWTGRRGIAAEHVMAIGDNWNDAEMLEFAGLPVLMGNSAGELKQRGWAVTATNDEDGVARAIERYILDSLLDK